jgi:ABC-type transporter Mla subunit MlaD
VISLTPGPNSNRPLPSGATIPATLISTPVEIDQIVSTLDAQTRTRLQQLIHGSAALYDGKTQQANDTLAALNPAIDETAGTLAELNRDQRAFTDAIVSSASLMSTLADQRDHLGGLLTGAAQLTSALARRTQSISAVLRAAPSGLNDFNGIIDRYRRVFRNLQPQAVKLSAVTPLINTTVAKLRPTLDTARTALPDIRALVGSLASTLARLPALRDAGVPALKSTRTALIAAIPILTGAVPYVPDVFQGLVGGFGGQVGGYYDANGGYVRIRPEVGSVALEGSLGSILNPLTPLTPLTATKFDPNRCAGGAADPAPDGSSPFEVPSSPCTNKGPNQ